MKKTAVLFILLLLLSGISFASLPDANIEANRLDIFYGSGYNLGWIGYISPDKSYWQGMSINYSANETEAFGIGYHYYESPEDYSSGSTTIYDLYYNLQFADEDENKFVNASLLTGAWIIKGPVTLLTVGDKDIITLNNVFLLELGICLSKNLIGDWLIGRCNIVYGPSMGLELGIKPSENFEFTVGYESHWYGIKVTI